MHRIFNAVGGVGNKFYHCAPQFRSNGKITALSANILRMPQVNQVGCSRNYGNNQDHKKSIFFMSFIFGIGCQLINNKAEAKGKSSFLDQGLLAYQRGYYKLALEELEKALLYGHSDLLANRIALVLTYIQLDNIPLAKKMIDIIIVDFDQFDEKIQTLINKLNAGTGNSLSINLLSSFMNSLALMRASHKLTSYAGNLQDDTPKLYAAVYALKGICRTLEKEEDESAMHDLEQSFIHYFPVLFYNKSKQESHELKLKVGLACQAEVMKATFDIEKLQASNVVFQTQGPERPFIDDILHILSKAANTLNRNSLQEAVVTVQEMAVKNYINYGLNQKTAINTVAKIRFSLAKRMGEVMESLEMSILFPTVRMLSSKEIDDIYAQPVSILFISLISGLKTGYKNQLIKELLNAAYLQKNRPLIFRKVPDLDHLINSLKTSDWEKFTTLVSDFTEDSVPKQLVLRAPEDGSLEDLIRTYNGKSLAKEILRFYSVE